MQQLDFFDNRTRADIAIERLQAFEPKEGYTLAFSGGKDSCVIKHLAERSGVKFVAKYNVTTVDPPELIRFINKYHHEVIRSRPVENMWQMIERQGPPFRHIRYCCRVLKESTERGFVVTGIRWAESAQRGNRKMVESCYKNTEVRYLHPIIDWSNADVWSYIRDNNLPYCPLYDEGWKRLGCVLCPMADRERERERWPKIAALYLRAFRKAYQKRLDAGKPVKQATAEEWFEFWISDRAKLKDLPDQMMIFE